MLYEVITGGVPLPLDDNVAVLLEKGDDFLRGRYGFTVDHASPGLVDDLTQQTDGPLQICRDSLGAEELKALIGTQFGNRRQGIVDDAFGIVDRITSYNVCYTKLLRPCVRHDQFGLREPHPAQQ